MFNIVNILGGSVVCDTMNVLVPLSVSVTLV